MGVPLMSHKKAAFQTQPWQLLLPMMLQHHWLSVAKWVVEVALEEAEEVWVVQTTAHCLVVVEVAEQEVLDLRLPAVEEVREVQESLSEKGEEAAVVVVEVPAEHDLLKAVEVVLREERDSRTPAVVAEEAQGVVLPCSLSSMLVVEEEVFQQQD